MRRPATRQSDGTKIANPLQSKQGINSPATNQAKLAVVPKGEIDPEFALAALRTVVARIRLIEAEVTEIGAALKQGRISTRTAINLTEEIAPGCFGAVAASMEMGHE
jgi:hypothetical protein